MEYYKEYDNNIQSLSYSKLICKKKEYYIDNNLVKNNRGIHDDIVYHKNNEIINIKTRTSQFIVGILYLNNTKYGFNKRNIPYYKFSPISNKFPMFIVPCKNKTKHKIYCVIKFNKWNIDNKHPIGQIEKIIGEFNNINNEYQMLLYKHHILPNKNKIKYNTLEEITQKVDYHVFSIDPIGCKDIDDALHIKYYNDYIEIGIHISSVSEFINDINLNMFSTIYLPNSQINMLSDEYSYNYCSLIHKKNRKALSLILKFKNFKIDSFHFQKSIVNTDNYTYSKADEIINSNNSHPIKDLYEFTLKYQNIDKIDSCKLIEIYMILCNSFVAKTLYNYNNNTILRVQKEKKQDINKNYILENYLNKTNRYAASYELNPENTSHYELNLDYYTHFTSPIRRYIDIINHYNIINYIENKPLITIDYLNKINDFNKNMRKLKYDLQKINFIYNLTDSIETEAYITEIKDTKIKVFITEYEIEHKFIIISDKLLDTNNITFNKDEIIINNISLRLYQKIIIYITPLPKEDIFNKKIHIKIINPIFNLI